MMLLSALDEQSQPRDNSEQPQAYLSDLKKAYPRVSKLEYFGQTDSAKTNYM